MSRSAAVSRGDQNDPWVLDWEERGPGPKGTKLRVDGKMGFAAMGVGEEAAGGWVWAAGEARRARPPLALHPHHYSGS